MHIMLHLRNRSLRTKGKTFLKKRISVIRSNDNAIIPHNAISNSQNAVLPNITVMELTLRQSIRYTVYRVFIK